MMAEPVLALAGVGKTFTMFLQGGVRLPVGEDVAFEVGAGECVGLGGPSGAGKSSIFKMVAGTYGASMGRILVRYRGAMVDIAATDDFALIAIRRETIANVTQFLHAIPRVPAVELVMARALGVVADLRAAAEALLARLNLPRPLWNLPPATFSGGEKQRVDIAAGFVRPAPLLLPDEPTASLVADNRAVVIAMIEEKKAAGTAILGIFHNAEVRERVADRVIDGRAFAAGRVAA